MEDAVHLSSDGLMLFRDYATGTPTEWGGSPQYQEYILNPNDWWQYIPNQYRQSDTIYVENKSKVESAFKIVQKMMEKGILEDFMDAKQFIELVNDIAGII